VASAFSLRFKSTFSRMQWRRGIRAGFAIACLMVSLHLLGRPAGWAAFGVLVALNVDNGGPYRSRFGTVMTVVAGGTLAIVIAAIASISLPVAIVVTSLFCFSVTLARVVSQPLASGSASILICYFVSYGAAIHTPATVRGAILYFIAGGIWAAAFSLVFWPLDPFGPARNAVADIYAKLAALTALPLEDSARFKDSVHQIRVLIEAAQGILIATPARMTARTVRARNLTVMVQAADLVFARLFRLAELGAHESLSVPESCQSAVREIAEWLAASLKPIEAALRQRPYDNAAAFVPEGSLLTEMRRRAKHIEAATTASGSNGISTQLRAQFIAVERDCLLSLEVIYESIRALWTGVEPTTTGLRSIFSNPAPSPSSPQIWLEALRSNFTSRSVMFRHALRLGMVAAADLLLLRLIHITHSYWMPMTSIIVLQPYTGETWRKSGDRVAGTVSGAILAAGLAAIMPSEAGIIAVISVGCIFALSVYAVDYAWYSFFITPTIVLLSQPHIGDWHLAAVRTGMTLLGAGIALAGMLVLWPQRESSQLPLLLARAAAMDAAYLRALLQFWQNPESDSHARMVTGRTILSPARRACGLASNDAEDSLDRALLEQGIPLPFGEAHKCLNQDALTFTTYIRRLSQSITTLVTIGGNSPELAGEVAALAARLDTVSAVLTERNAQSRPFDGAAPLISPHPSLAEQQMIRIQHQVNVLERAAADIAVNI
jgi:uncharacterized membrane protein YccC